jgi:hypothetical protein
LPRIICLFLSRSGLARPKDKGLMRGTLMRPTVCETDLSDRQSCHGVSPVQVCLQQGPSGTRVNSPSPPSLQQQAWSHVHRRARFM